MVPMRPCPWRVLVSALILQVIGGGVAWLVPFHYSGFQRFCVGAGIAGLPGLGIGAVWHFWLSNDLRSDHGLRTMVVGVIIILLGSLAAMDAVRMQHEMVILRHLRQLDVDVVDRIVIHSEHSHAPSVVDEREAIAQFVRACQGIEFGGLSHPNYTGTYRVDVSGFDPVIELSYQRARPDVVVGRIVDPGKRVRNAAFLSSALKDWLDDHAR